MEFIWSFGAFRHDLPLESLCKNNHHPFIQGYFIAITFAGSPGRYLNTWPSGLVFKQLPRDPANVNA